jgi:hypothetical protein
MKDRSGEVTEMDGRAVNCPRRGEVDIEVCLTCGWNRGLVTRGGGTDVNCAYSSTFDLLDFNLRRRQ